MDATRTRRTRDRARQTWYAQCRQKRFARFLGFASGTPATIQATCQQWGRDDAPLKPTVATVEIDMTQSVPLATLNADATLAAPAA